MGVDSTWRPGFDANLTIAGVEMPAMTLTLDDSLEEFETTNTLSNGDFEFGVAVRTRGFDFDLPVDSAAPIIPAIGDLVAVVYTDGEFIYTGKGRITKRSPKGGGKGGLSYSCSGKFTGAVVTTAAP